MPVELPAHPHPHANEPPAAVVEAYHVMLREHRDAYEALPPDVRARAEALR